LQEETQAMTSIDYWAEAPMDRKQVALFVPTLNAMISEDDPVRLFDEILDGVDGVAKIRLIPIDLQFDKATDYRGSPRVADSELGSDIISRIAEISRRYGSSIAYDDASNSGHVQP
jgi:hypothetical protein